MATSGKRIYNWKPHAGFGRRSSYLMVTLYSERDPSTERSPPHPPTPIRPLKSAKRKPPLTRGSFSIIISTVDAPLSTCGRERVPVDLASAPRKVGLRGCYSRPSVWPPLAPKHK